MIAIHRSTRSSVFRSSSSTLLGGIWCPVDKTVAAMPTAAAATMANESATPSVHLNDDLLAGCEVSRPKCHRLRRYRQSFRNRGSSGPKQDHVATLK